MPDLVNQSLGRYHILEKLGEGGMAVVYKAFDTRLERDVAIKVIRVDQFSQSTLESVLQRFEREAKALAKLSHPNIVSVIDYGEQEGLPYLVMEYLPGGTLKGLIGQPMPWTKAARLLRPIARGLAYAHQRGIVHRDVKPSNILIGDSGEPMLTDFGIAKILEGRDAQTLTATGVGLGTPEYMAPEQWTGQAGVRADIYSLGVVFYELVTGRKPYIADTPAAILLKQTNDPLPRPKSFVANLPEEVEKILYRALAKNPADRYASMEKFALALENLEERRTKVDKTALQPSRKQPDPKTIKAELTQANRTPKRPSAKRSKGVGKHRHLNPIVLWGSIAGLMILLGGWFMVAPRLIKNGIPEPTQISQTPALVGTKQYSAAPPMLIDKTKQYFATVTMAKGGEFVIQLYPDKAPITVNSFVFLARQGFFDGVTFHRVIPGFMAQGGGPTGTGSGGPGYEFVNEDSDLKFDKAGVVAMANAGRDTNGSQFFITFGPQAYLNGGYTIFGQVVSGMDVVNGITPRDPTQNPTFSGDAIATITITEK